MISRQVVRKICILVLSTSHLLSSAACATDKPPFDELDMSRPGISQERLDQYVSDKTKYLMPYIDNVFPAETIKAYEAAAAKLTELRSDQLIRGQYGLGSVRDYLVGTGELEQSFIIAFLPRYSQNSEAQIVEAQENKDAHWSAYYNVGNSVPIIFSVSKADFSIICYSESFSDCVPEKTQ